MGIWSFEDEKAAFLIQIFYFGVSTKLSSIVNHHCLEYLFGFIVGGVYHYYFHYHYRDYHDKLPLWLCCRWRIQLTKSSRAKHGGAYFSAVFGRKFDLTTVLRPCQPLACYWRVGIAAAPTLFTTSTKHHGSR